MTLGNVGSHCVRGLYVICQHLWPRGCRQRRCLLGNVRVPVIRPAHAVRPVRQAWRHGGPRLDRTMAQTVRWAVADPGYC